MKTQNQNKKTQRDTKNPLKGQKKEKFQPKSFKKFIYGGIDTVNEFIPGIAAELVGIFGVSNDIILRDVENLDEMAADMFKTFSMYTPDMKAKGENSYWSLTYASNRIALKTEFGYQFGWMIKYNKDRSDYESVEFFYTAYSVAALPETEEYENYGWNLEE